MAMPEEPKLESRRAKKVGFLGRGCSPPNIPFSAARWSGERCSKPPSGVRGEAPTIWRFGTFLQAYKAAPVVDFVDIKFQ